MNRKKKYAIAFTSVIVPVLLIVIIRFLYIEAKKVDVDIEYTAVILRYDEEDSTKYVGAEETTISIKGTFDFRDIEEKDTFEGEIIIGDTVFSMNKESENVLAVSYFEDSDWWFLSCFEKKVGGANWFSIVTKDLDFETMYIKGMGAPTVHEYSNCYIVAPANDEEAAFKILDDLRNDL